MGKKPKTAPPVERLDAPEVGAWPADRVERRPIAGLARYARNARTHSAEQVALLAESIRKYGWTMPVLVDEPGEIIAGHGRVLAAERLGLVDAPVMVATGWTAAQKRAYRLADNKLALASGWDNSLLASELGELRLEGFDLNLTGFGETDLGRLGVIDLKLPAPGGNYHEQYGVIVICRDEAEQRAVYERLVAEKVGVEVRVVAT